VDSTALRAHAAAHLGRFEVPTQWWIRRQSLPTNASGEILRRRIVDEWPEV
jgi:long-chain acyl-CoA synthetase